MIEFHDQVQVPNAFDAGDIVIYDGTNVNNPANVVVEFLGTPADDPLVTLGINDMDGNSGNGSQGIVAGAEVGVTFAQSGGIKNPTEGHSGRTVKVSTTHDAAVTGAVGQKFNRVLELNSRGGERGSVVTALGKGFKNGTDAVVWLDANQDDNKDPGEADLCSATVASDDTFTCDFVANAADFRPNVAETITAKDGRNQKADETASWTLKGQVEAVPNRAAIGDTVTIEFRDFPDEVINILRLGGVSLIGDGPGQVPSSFNPATDGSAEVTIPDNVGLGAQALDAATANSGIRRELMTIVAAADHGTELDPALISVQHNPAGVGEPAQVTVRFTAVHELKPGDWIIIEFHNHVQVPNVLKVDQITINDGTNLNNPARSSVEFVGTPANNPRVSLGINDMDGNSGNGLQGIAAGAEVTVRFAQSAGIKNPTEGHIGRTVKVSTTHDAAVTGAVGQKFNRVLELNSRGGERGSVVTALGKGFKNGTDAVVWLDRNGNNNQGPNETVLCHATVDKDDKFTCDFVANAADFRPYVAETITAKDGRNQKADETASWTLKGQVVAVPNRAAIGDTVTIEFRDFPDEVINILRLGGVSLIGDGPGQVPSSFNPATDGSAEVTIPDNVGLGKQSLAAATANSGIRRELMTIVAAADHGTELDPALISVRHNPAGVGDPAKVIVKFTAVHELKPGDWIIIEFHNQVQVPNVLKVDQITINDGTNLNNPARSSVKFVGTPANNPRVSLGINDMDGNSGNGLQGIAAGAEVRVTFAQSAGIKNPTEGHSGRKVKVSTTHDAAVTGAVGQKFNRVLELNSRGGERGSTVTALGKGFKNGTDAVVWLDRNGNNNQGPNETVLCHATVDKDDKFTCKFVVNAADFRPNVAETITAKDGRNQKADETASWTLKGQVEAVPNRAAIGDTVTIEFRDFPDEVINILRLGGVSLIGDGPRPGALLFQSRHRRFSGSNNSR